jgi:small-conductance mechanosensitive channel
MQEEPINIGGGIKSQDTIQAASSIADSLKNSGGKTTVGEAGSTTDSSLLERLKAEAENITAILPNIVGAILVFLIGWLIAKTIARVIKKVLGKVGIDKLAERLNEIEIVYKSNIKIVPSILLSKIVYYMLMLIVIMAATDVLKMQAVSKLVNDIINYIPSLLTAMAILAIGILVADTVKNAVQTACTSLAIPAGKVISSVVFYFLFINVLMMALSQAQLETGFIESNISIILAGVVGAFAIGYGFASRNIVASLLTSFYNKERVKIGDYIRIAGVEGRVTGIDSTSMTLLTPTGGEVVVPLHKLSSEMFEIVGRRQEQV